MAFLVESHKLLKRSGLYVKPLTRNKNKTNLFFLRFTPAARRMKISYFFWNLNEWNEFQSGRWGTHWIFKDHLICYNVWRDDFHLTRYTSLSLKELVIPVEARICFISNHIFSNSHPNSTPNTCLGLNAFH